MIKVKLEILYKIDIDILIRYEWWTWSILQSSQKLLRLPQIRKRIKVSKRLFSQSLETYIWHPKDISLKRHTIVMAKSTTAVVGNDTEALGCCGLITTFMVDHDLHELTVDVVNLPSPLPNHWHCSGWLLSSIVAMLLIM